MNKPTSLRKHSKEFDKGGNQQYRGCGKKGGEGVDCGTKRSKRAKLANSLQSQSDNSKRKNEKRRKIYVSILYIQFI